VEAAMKRGRVRYDVFETPCRFEIVGEAETQVHREGVRRVRVRLREKCAADEAAEVEIARDVAAATAAEIVGIPASCVAQLESAVAKYGCFSVGTLSEGFEVRRTR
jgi:hypothetical protein